MKIKLLCPFKITWNCPKNSVSLNRHVAFFIPLCVFGPLFLTLHESDNPFIPKSQSLARISKRRDYISKRNSIWNPSFLFFPLPSANAKNLGGKTIFAFPPFAPCFPPKFFERHIGGRPINYRLTSTPTFTLLPYPLTFSHHTPSHITIN